MLHPVYVSPAILEWDGELRLARWTKPAETLCGCNAWQVMGLDPRGLPFLAEPERYELLQGLERIAAGIMERDVALLRVRARDGSEQPCVWLSYPLRDGEGRITAILSIIHQATVHMALSDPAGRKETTQSHHDTMPAAGTVLPGPEEMQERIAEKMAENTPTHRPGTPAILIVEDNPINQHVTCLVLEHLGHYADTVGSGHAALQALKLNRYDIVLMDIELPGMDGMETTARIRKDLPASQQPWIIAMTSHCTEPWRTLCLQSGMNAFLQKPIAKESLALALKEATGAALLSAKDTPLHGLHATLGTDDPGVVRDIITQYLSSTAAAIITMRMKCAERNIAELARIAHMLKSSSSMLGADALSGMFMELEELAYAEKLAQAESLLTTIVAEFRRVEQRLTSESI